MYNLIITLRMAGPAVYIIKRYNRMNQLHESSRCMVGRPTSNTCLCNDLKHDQFPE